MARLKRVVLGRRRASLEGKRAVASGQGAARQPQEPGAVGMRNPRRLESKTPFEHLPHCHRTAGRPEQEHSVAIGAVPSDATAENLQE